MTALPSYIDADLWQDFIEGRREMQTKSRVPFTAVAQKRILMKLMKMHDEGHDANQALEDAVCNSWRSVFVPKPTAKQQQGRTAPLSFAEQDRLSKMERWEQMTGRQHPDRVQHLAPDVIDMFDPQDRRLGYGTPTAPH